MDLQAILDSTTTSLEEEEEEDVTNVVVEDDDDDDDDDVELMIHNGYFPHHRSAATTVTTTTTPRFRSEIEAIPDHCLMSDSLTEDDDDYQQQQLLLQQRRRNRGDDTNMDGDDGIEVEDYIDERQRQSYYSSSLLGNQTTFKDSRRENQPRSAATNATSTINSTLHSGMMVSTSGMGIDVDLERILREDDDDDDSGSDHLLFRSHHTNSQRNLYQPNRMTEMGIDDDDDDDDYGNDGFQSFPFTPKGVMPANSSRKYGTTTTTPAAAPTMTPLSSSGLMPDDWHVLQAILGEDEDDVEVVSPLHHHLLHHHLLHHQNQSSSSLQHHLLPAAVDTILQQADNDDYVDQNSDGSHLDNDLHGLKATLTDPLLDLPQFIPQLQVPFQRSQPSEENFDLISRSGTTDGDLAIVPTTYSNESFQTATQSIPDVDSTSIPVQGSGGSHHPPPENELRLLESQWAIASERAMHYAQQYETRLLKPTTTTLSTTTANGTLSTTSAGGGFQTPINKEIVSPLMVKRRLKPKIYLQSKSFQANKGNIMNSSTHSPSFPTTSSARPIHALTTMNGAVEFRHMHGVSNTLAQQASKQPPPMTPTSHRHPQQQQQFHQPQSSQKKDLPTALGMNDRFLAVGMQSGVCLIFDLFETFRKKLDKGGDTPFDSRAAGAVTTLDLSFEQGDVLVAGYTSGYIVLWDVLKGVALRTVIESPPSLSSSGLNSAPSCMTHVRFLKGLEVVTVDAGGLVNKLHFSKNMLWSSYSVESECLLDGTAGQILAMNVLDPTQSNNPTTNISSIHPKGLVLIALSSERSSFAVAVAPTVHVLYRWPKPSMNSITSPSGTTTTAKNQVYLPCLSWGWSLVSGGDHIKTPILARAWGCSIQFLRASFQDTNTTDRTTANRDEDHSHASNAITWPAFGVHDEFDSSSPVVAMEWLNDRSLVYLTVQNEFFVVDTVMMTLVEKIDCSGMSLVYAEFSLSRTRSSTDNNNANPKQSQPPSQKDPNDPPSSPSFCTTFQNSIRSRDNRLLVLCQSELQSVSIVGAKRRISQLEQDGEWLEALASALDHYESTISSQQDRRRDQKKDLSKHPEYSLSGNNSKRLLSPDEEWIAKLLIRYINIAMENAPDMSDYELAQSHFQMLAGVCVEFCVVTKRLDLLYGAIFRRFHSSGCLSIFLDVIEPYILNDKLDYIAPEAMAHFVEHCRISNGMATVERCLLHMDVTIMDFDSILTLLKANGMYSALFYVYNQGLNDYSSPLEILLEKLFDASDTLLASSNPATGISIGKQNTKQQSLVGGRKNGQGGTQSDLERYGYKAILYLQYCFQGRTFPQNTPIEDELLLSKIRSELLLFLLQENFEPKSIRKHGSLVGQRTQLYPYTSILLSVDPKAMLKTLSLAMDAPDGFFKGGESSLESIGGWEVEVGTDRSNHTRSVSSKSLDRQDIIRMLLSILLPDHDSGMFPVTKPVATGGPNSLYKSQRAVNAMLDFLAEYLMKGVVQVTKHVTLLILNRMASLFEMAADARDRLDSQRRLLELLTALPHNSYEPEEVLVLVQKSGIHRAALLLHQEGASSWGKGTESQQELEHRAYHFKAAIDCYLDDDDADFCREVFSYVKKECSSVNPEYQRKQLKDESSDSNSLKAALASKLADLVQLDSLLTAELVAELYADELDAVVSQLHNEQAQFLFFQAIISGDLNERDQVAGAVLNANLTVDHHHRYLELMAKLHPNDVYEYLQTHDSYRPEACLPLCQKYDIADASCYLMERMGNVSSGLQLILQTLESRLMALKRTIRGMGTSSTYSKYGVGIRHNKPIGASSSNSAAAVAIDATEREVQGVKRILVVTLDLCERNSGTFSSRTEHGSQLWFNVLDRLINAKGFLRLTKEQPGHARIMAGVLSDLLRLVMQRMVSSVPLPDLVRKVTSDHSGSRLGELREMVESLLSTYGFELTLFEGAVSVFRHDMKEMQGQNRSLRIQGDRVTNTWNYPTSSSSSSSSSPFDANKENHQKRQRANPSSSVLTNPPEGLESRGLGASLLKLQQRRRQQRSFSSATNSSGRSQNVGQQQQRRRAKISLMSESDRKIFVEGEENPDVTYWEDRMVGALGAAEHSGRFRSFLY